MTEHASPRALAGSQPTANRPLLRNTHFGTDGAHAHPGFEATEPVRRPRPRNGLRFWVISDLRIDRAPDFRLPDQLPDFDAMLVAGGVRPGIDAALRWLAEALDGRQRERPVVFVPGAVEFWSDVPMYEALDQGRALARELGLILLHDETIRLSQPNRPGVQLVGSTLWTDWALQGAFQGQLARVQARHSWSCRKKVWLRGGERLSPIDALGLHARSRAYIEDVLTGIVHQATLRCGPPPNAIVSGVEPGDVAVVLTHYAPSPRSLPADWSGWLSECWVPASRASDLESVTTRWGAPALWVHGNVPRAVDHHVGRTRIVANPRRDRWVQPNFDGGCLVQL